MDQLTETLRKAPLIAAGIDGGKEIRHYLLPDGNVAEIILPLN